MIFFNRYNVVGVFSIALLIILSNGLAQIRITEVFSTMRFSTPTAIVSPNDGSNRLAIASREGQIYIFADAQNTSSRTLFLDLNVLRDRNETGLIGFAFHPNYSSNGKFYVYYSTDPTAGNHHDNLISEFTVSTNDPNVADPNSEREIMNLGQWPAFMHNSGCLRFGPDGYLYAVTGDPTQTGSQSLMSLYGKIIRIDINNTDPGLQYAIPSDNPYVGSGTDRGEIWAHGFRNPWQFSFDSQTNKLYAGGVGSGHWEWIDTVVKGGNYRWPELEGSYVPGTNTPASPAQRIGKVMPLYEYTPAPARGTVIGGYVYRGPNATLHGIYFFARRIAASAWGLQLNGNQIVDTLSIGATDGGATCFGVGENKELYMGTDRGIFIFEGTGPVLSNKIKSQESIRNNLSVVSPNSFLIRRFSRKNIQFELQLYKSIKARIEIIDHNGIIVKLLADENYSSGQHILIWDGTNENNKLVSPGIYFYGFTSKGLRSYKNITIL